MATVLLINTWPLCHIRWTQKRPLTTKPCLNVNTVVNICDKLLRQMIKESNIMQEKNVIQKLQTGVISVLNRKGITVFKNFNHSDDPSVVQKHSLIIVKKIVQVHASIRLKFHCKTIRQTLLEKNVRKKLSKLIHFKNQ